MELCRTVKEFIDEITEMHLSELRATDEEYQCTNRELIRLSEKVQRLMNALSEEQRRTFMDYSNLRSQQEAANSAYLYWSGLLDAVVLLKTLGVL